MVYQHPLAYLLGIEGVALLRACAGGYDRAFVEARFAEIADLVAGRRDDGVVVEPVDTVDGYRVWSETYDGEPRNGLFDIDEPVLHELIDARPTGVALDAACGTGRHTEYLAGRGHRVTGVDSSPEMLARAAARVPAARFLVGDLHRLPVADGAVDLITCSLALTHIADLGPVIAEFGRALRPGGHLLISDVHRELVTLGSAPRLAGPGGAPVLMSGHRHLASDYIAAALAAGLRVRRCLEPRSSGVGEPPSSTPDESAPDESTPDDSGALRELTPAPWEFWPWWPMEVVPEAAGAAWGGLPVLVIWDFEREG